MSLPLITGGLAIIKRWDIGVPDSVKLVLSGDERPVLISLAGKETVASSIIYLDIWAILAVLISASFQNIGESL